MRPAEFKNREQELERFQRRLAVAGGFVLFAFFLLFSRFFWLQVVQHEHYRTRAEDNRIALVPIVPNRGLIVDRNGVVLARNYSAYTLEITPSKVADLEAMIDELAGIVDIQPKDRKRFRKLLEESKNFESLPIRTRLTDEEVARFIAQRFRFPGADIKARLFRQYPHGELASHALGYIGRVNDRDLVAIEKNDAEDNYRGTEHFGKTGLEQRYEFELHGQTGFEQVEVDAGGRAVRVLERTPPVSGNNLVLTLDAKLQQVVEKAFGSRRGALVAIEPSTGGVLALVSMPGYDPNLFVDGINIQDWEALNTSEDKPMVNRALNGAYPPGSTFKPFMALAALETASLGDPFWTELVDSPNPLVIADILADGKNDAGPRAAAAENADPPPRCPIGRQAERRSCSGCHRWRGTRPRAPQWCVARSSSGSLSSSPRHSSRRRADPRHGGQHVLRLRASPSTRPRRNSRRCASRRRPTHGRHAQAADSLVGRACVHRC